MTEERPPRFALCRVCFAITDFTYEDDDNVLCAKCKPYHDELAGPHFRKLYVTNRDILANRLNDLVDELIALRQRLG